MSDFSDEHFSDSDDEDSENEAAHSRQRQEDMDKLVAPLGPGEYGQMPASPHENSQPVKQEAQSEESIDIGTKINSKSETTDTPSGPPVRARPPILPHDKYDGVDSDDESDEEDLQNPFRIEEDGEDEEDRPQVVGEVEIDMAEEEEEFLAFSRKALGISDEQWGDIVRERRGRGGRRYSFCSRFHS
jgi:hypothetical protein